MVSSNMETDEKKRDAASKRTCKIELVLVGLGDAGGAADHRNSGFCSLILTKHLLEYSECEIGVKIHCV